MGQAGRASKYVAAHYLAEALVALGTETDDKACFTDGPLCMLTTEQNLC